MRNSGVSNDAFFINRAIELSKQALESGNHPFGALLVDDHGNILLEAQNTVITAKDITGHAELNLVRAASASYDPDFLASCTLYTSTEPCPMCSGAIFWSNIRRVVYGMGADQLYELVGWESEEILNLPCKEVFHTGHKKILVEGPIQENDARQVHIGFWSTS
jgi:tRNA(Arg) A34 adenosine deaminase TadA